MLLNKTVIKNVIHPYMVDKNDIKRCISYTFPMHNR